MGQQNILLGTAILWLGLGLGVNGGLLDDLFPTASADIAKEAAMTTPELITKYGYTPETVIVTTADGYILRMHHITDCPQSPALDGRPPALMVPGYQDSSFAYVSSSRAFGLVACEAGYDVWLGNFRGNVYSTAHVSLSTESPAFWNFTYHEVGVYDLPAMIDMITAKTGQQEIHYVGHSEGTTSFFVMASERVAYNARILLMVAMAPVVFSGNCAGALWRTFTEGEATTYDLEGSDSYRQVFASSPTLAEFALTNCCKGALLQGSCVSVLNSVSGTDAQQLNTTRLPVYLGHFPAGGSSKTAALYGQDIRTGKFQTFDYGAQINQQLYNQSTPRDYALGNVTAPVALFSGLGDLFVAQKDLDILRTQLRNVVSDQVVADPNFNHMNFVWGIYAEQLVYKPALALMANYTAATAN